MGSRRFDVAIIGAGVLGVCLAHWIALRHNLSIVLVDREPGPAYHQSSRNTGVVHRPFYLDPAKKRTFARSALLSYAPWMDLASRHRTPWAQVGTLQLAVEESEIATLEKYVRWGLENGMESNELSLLSGAEVRLREPLAEGRAGLFVSSDVSTDFGALTRVLHGILLSQGVTFIGMREVRGVNAGTDGVTLVGVGGGVEERISCGFLINCAGGGALRIAHRMGLALEYSSMNFRGEYWGVEQAIGARVRSNIYTVPKHKDFPFLDPHLIVRADGRRDLGPSAVWVAGPYTYEGFGLRELDFLAESPVSPRLSLLTSSTFRSLVADEWMSSVSKRMMAARARRFIPGLDAKYLSVRGTPGVRASLVDRSGFIPEAVQIGGEHSHHILNYNSPGATGAPSFSAMVVSDLEESGYLPRGVDKPIHDPSLWNFDSVLGPS